MDNAQEPSDRRELARIQGPKPARWPRTTRRQERVERVLRRRQPDVTVVLENVHDPHNVSAVLRSCDAVGVLGIHIVYSIEAAPERAFARSTSASAAKWVNVTKHQSISDCYAVLRGNDFAILAAAPGAESTDLYDLDLTRPAAFVFGNEMRGLTEQARTGADQIVAVPMVGMVRSLNISVACAVTLYEVFRQRRVAGRYDSAQLSSDQLARMMDEWLLR